MDNENLEIVNEATPNRLPWNANVDTKKLTSQVLPVAGGMAAAAIGCYLLYRFVAKPLFAKAKAKKAESVTAPAEEEKTEEKS